MATRNSTTKKKIIKINTSTFLGSVYSQIVGVTVTDTDITLEFVYKNPRGEITDAQVVARVTVPRKTGEELVSTIANTVKLHESGKKGKRND